MTTPQLGRRATIAYNRLSRDLAALNYVLRINKPAGMVGDLTLRQSNSITHEANRLFCRELALPRFHMIDAERPLTVADFAILVTRLTMAAQAFHSQPSVHILPIPPPAPRPGPSLPAPHFHQCCKGPNCKYTRRLIPVPCRGGMLPAKEAP